ncbi:hypothetical protein XU18_3390 [Perkinsela sp. CCAP 1560/4]|nr:hypothetical protein XU18_3390 [Perkinsela sp. CCAP 1560/4]|eukprot:KNH05619.1 hypothetical protein XU18_3390 [Perkinsela sp. CCAP 1560/4]
MTDVWSAVREQKLPHIGTRWTQKNLIAVSLLCGLGMMLHGGFLTHKYFHEESIRIEYTDSNCTWWTAEKAILGNEILSMGCMTTRKFVIPHAISAPLLSYRLVNFDYADSAVFNDTLKLYNSDGKCICDTSNPPRKGTTRPDRDVCVDVRGFSNRTAQGVNIDEWNRAPMLRSMRRPWKRIVGDLLPGEYTLVISDRYHMREPNGRKYVDLHVDKWPGIWSHLLGPMLTAVGTIQTILILILALVFRFRGRSESKFRRKSLLVDANMITTDLPEAKDFEFI